MEEDPPVLEFDVEETERVFGKPTRSPEETFGDAARRILALEGEVGK